MDTRVEMQVDMWIHVRVDVWLVMDVELWVETGRLEGGHVGGHVGRHVGSHVSRDVRAGYARSQGRRHSSNVTPIFLLLLLNTSVNNR